MKEIGKIYEIPAGTDSTNVLKLAVALHEKGYNFYPFIKNAPWHRNEDNPKPIREDIEIQREYEILNQKCEKEGVLECDKKRITAINSPSLVKFLSEFKFS